MSTDLPVLLPNHSIDSGETDVDIFHILLLFVFVHSTVEENLFKSLVLSAILCKFKVKSWFFENILLPDWAFLVNSLADSIETANWNTYDYLEVVFIRFAVLLT